MANDQPYNIFGVVSGTIGILAAVIPLVLWLIYLRLPRSKIQSLESLLSETEKLLTSAVQEGVVDDAILYQFHGRLFEIKQLVHVIRAEVHNTRNIWQDVKRWWKGLSLKMSAVCATMKVLRAEISGRCSDAAVGAKNEDTALLEASFKQLSSQRASNSLSSVEKLPADAEHFAPPSLTRVITPADVVEAGECTKDSPPQCPEDHHRLRAERRRATRQILLRLGRELAAGLGVPYKYTSRDTAHDTQKLHGTKGRDHGSASRTSLKSSCHTPDLPLHSHPCCEEPLDIDLMSELLLDALEASDSSDSSDDEGDGGEEGSCDLGVAKLPV